MSPTPNELGYAMPAEWEPHEATWLAWPHDPLTWPGRLADVERVYLEMMRALSPHERVDLLVNDTTTRDRVKRRLDDERIRSVALHIVPTADAWIRDYGPNFLKRRRDGNVEVAYNRWRFNAWGHKYDNLLPDDGIPERLPTIQTLPRFAPDLVLEGGSVDVNGRGTVLTTEQCLLNPNRNPGRTRDQLETALRDYLGVSQFLWLRDGIAGDDTDGHVDDVARFADAQTIICAVEPDARDPNHKPLEENRRRLADFRDPKGRPFRIVELPMPGPIEGDEGRLPASYANFYIANRVVLVPAFGHPNDAKAQGILARLFSDRRIAPLRCEDLVCGLGTLHCITQQQPAAR